MKIKCMITVPVADQTVTSIIDAMKQLPESATLTTGSFGSAELTFWWEEDRA